MVYTLWIYTSFTSPSRPFVDTLVHLHCYRSLRFPFIHQICTTFFVRFFTFAFKEIWFCFFWADCQRIHSSFFRPSICKECGLDFISDEIAHIMLRNFHSIRTRFSICSNFSSGSAEDSFFASQTWDKNSLSKTQTDVHWIAVYDSSDLKWWMSLRNWHSTRFIFKPWHRASNQIHMSLLMCDTHSKNHKFCAEQIEPN